MSGKQGKEEQGLYRGGGGGGGGLGASNRNMFLVCLQVDGPISGRGGGRGGGVITGFHGIQVRRFPL